jgi:hypothetical protein
MTNEETLILKSVLQNMQLKYKPKKNEDIIAITLEGNDIVVSRVSGIDWEPDYWHELERIKIL